MTRSERRLVCAGLLVIAAAILFETVRLPGLYPTSVPQTDPVSAVSATVSRYAVNVNEATVEELMGVRGISRELAQNIVNDRSEHGRFFSTDDLVRVAGIGEKTLEQLRVYLTAA